MVKEKDREELLQIEEVGEAVEQIEHTKPYKRYLDASLGLRNHWYPAFFSQELAEGQLKGEMLLGERIAFKRAGGTVYAFEDRCAHRAAPFSARPECYTENTVTCWLHGFTYDVRDGKLVQVVSEPGSAIIGKVSIKTYPTEEHNGVVFVFVGDLDPAPPITDDIQPKFFNKGLVFHPLMRHKIRCNWRVAAENGYDAAHIYGHRGAEIFKRFNVAIPLGTYPSTRDNVTVVEGDGPKGIVKLDDINVWSAEIEGVQITAANVDAANPPPAIDIAVGLFMPCGLEVDWFPAPGMIHFEWYVPIDEDHHMYMITQSKYVETEAEAKAFPKECDDIFGPLVWQRPDGQTDPMGDGPTWGFNNFDAFGREQIHHSYEYENWWNRERLFKPDYIIVRWRMLVDTHARGIQKRGNWARTHGWSPRHDGYQPDLAPGDFPAADRG